MFKGMIKILGTILGCTAADQLSKAAVRAVVQTPQSVITYAGVGLDITPVWNGGVSWGLFSGTVPWWGLAVLEVGLMIMVGWWLMASSISRERWGLTLIMGGALGNLIDRIMFGKVFDFLDFYWHRWHFATFNVADIWISLGFLVMIWEVMRRPIK